MTEDSHQEPQQELATKQRMEHCAAIASQLMAHWEATGNFEYTLRATAAIGGLELKELRERKFVLGLGDELSELSLDEVLAVFSLLEQQGLAMQQLQNQPQGTYTFTAQVPEKFSDLEAVRILSQLKLQTPHDSGEVAQWLLGKRPSASGEPTA